MAFKKETKIKTNFTRITVGLASPQQILEESYGEVLKARDRELSHLQRWSVTGLFCERIFGPTKGLRVPLR